MTAQTQSDVMMACFTNVEEFIVACASLVATDEIDIDLFVRLMFSVSHTNGAGCFDTLFLQIDTVLVDLHLEFPIVQHFALDLFVQRHSLVVATGIRLNLREELACCGSAISVLVRCPSLTGCSEVDVALVIDKLLVDLQTCCKGGIVVLALLRDETYLEQCLVVFLLLCQKLRLLAAEIFPPRPLFIPRFSPY